MIIGIDMGGTNIDGVVISPTGLIKTLKQPVDRSDIFGTIWRMLTELIEGLDPSLIRRIQLSTTISTNAIVEQKSSRVGLILQPGPGLRWDYDKPGESIRFVLGSVDHRGIPVASVDLSELASIKQAWADEPIEALAVVSKFSPRNPEAESEIGAYFSEDYRDITLGHRLSGKLNFPRRVETAYLNASVASTFRAFGEAFGRALREAGITAPVYILKADGGTIDLAGALDKPVETILSGPAASFMGMSALLEDTGTDRILIDIGGTTTDIFFLVDDVPVFEPLGITIGGRRTLVRAIFSHSIGLGGDSDVRFEGDDLMIGPQRSSHAIAFGGDQLTPTDALVYLGEMEAEQEAKSRQAIEDLARSKGLSPKALAEMIRRRMGEIIAETVAELLEKLNSSPVYTIKELLSDRAIKPRSIGLIGGPAKALADTLHQSLELPVDYPENYAVANAIGAALAKPTLEIHLLADTDREILTIPELGIYRSVDDDFDLDSAKQLALEQVSQAGRSLGLSDEQLVAEIVEAESFNMVQGYYRAKKNIRIKAQIRPGLVMRLSSKKGK